jgi:ribosome biogenesis GTPase
MKGNRMGWNGFFESAFEPYHKKGYSAGRIIAEHKNIYRVSLAGEELLARITGKLLHHANDSGEFPAVGDWVALRIAKQQEEASIHAILPRKSKFSRKTAGEKTLEQIAAVNVDTVFLIQGLDHDFNLRRTERYLVMAWESGAQPVIILAKADLCSDVEEKLGQVELIAPGVAVHAISSLQNQGIEQLNPYLSPGQTVAFLGSSGAGKSTLINRLLGQEKQKVQEVREDDSHGRHTTTYRELIELPSGACLIDTPGMRELQLWSTGEGLQDAFTDIASLSASCRFDDCLHDTEPDCVVKEALENGALDPDRFESYLKLRRELEYINSKENLKLALERKAKVRSLHRMIRKTIKHKRT